MNGGIDFGYPWWLGYGHLILAAILALVYLIGRMRKWHKAPMIILAVLMVWAGVAFVSTRFVIGFNSRGDLPTERFFASGAGRVLDIGAGTGRSSIMLLEARPKATLVALDLFGDSFDHHFGRTGTPQERLMANLKAAGVDGRASIQTADMRKLPFEARTFDAIISSYAIDHLNGEGIRQALAEAARVIKPGGEFLLMVVGKDPWLQFTFGPLLMHSGTRGQTWWTQRLEESGFQVMESGMRPATLFLLARR